MNHIRGDIPIMETRRLILRPIAWEDVDFIFNQFSNPYVTEYLFDQDSLTERVQAEEIIRFYLESGRESCNRWVMVLRSEKAPIGTLGFHKWDQRNKRVEVGYDLQRNYWGQGLMSEALKEILNYSFLEMEVNRIDALVAVENTASLRLLERNGFVREGILQDYFYQAGKYHDHCILCLLKKVWNARSNTGG